MVTGGDPTVLTARTADPDRGPRAKALEHAVALDEFPLASPASTRSSWLTGHLLPRPAMPSSGMTTVDVDRPSRPPSLRSAVSTEARPPQPSALRAR